EMRALVEEISARLGSVAQGTETLLASAEEIAASSEEQSASTEEIASSANQLAEAADKLTGAVKSFRLLADEVPPPERQAADRCRPLTALPAARYSVASRLPRRSAASRPPPNWCNSSGAASVSTPGRSPHSSEPRRS